MLNVNDDPPLDVVTVIAALLLDDTEKSAASPVVAPLTPKTVMVQPTLLPSLKGFPAEHDS